MEQEKQVETYIKTLSEKEYKAYLIAKEHLGDSFQIEKSNGYLSWLTIQQNHLEPEPTVSLLS